MPPLQTDLRKRLEKSIVQARAKAEQGARKALEALAIGRHEPHGSMSPEERALRRRLRAHGRQLGDERDKQEGTQTTRRLEREVAYEHWHRMLFARFLAENELLIEPTSGVAVTLEECEELARERSLDPWALAASFAEGMLPQIFRADDPALALALPPETRQALAKLLADLPVEVFTADDALGWTYQFWQSAEKEAVNARVKSGEKITGETLPAVTQLFTEPYMVQFLLHNTIGAWHAGKVLSERPELAAGAKSEEELRDAVALDGTSFEYLRFVRDPQQGEDEDAEAEPSGPWRPAAGTYPGWPDRACKLKVLDPCCGSGHFLVAAFDLLVRLRQSEEGLGTEDAIRAVLADNLFGLELDARCTQIAAFHLALAAWRLAGRHIELPALHLACSGLGPNASKEEWLALAEQAAAAGGMPGTKNLFGKQESLLSDALRNGLESLHETFTLAPELGSLIDPKDLSSGLFLAGFDKLQPLLAAALAAESASAETKERAVAAQGMAKAAEILTAGEQGYTLVLTNVPYLGRGSQSDLLKDFADQHYKEAKNDLATIFFARMLRWVGRTGTIAAVTPQNWLFLTSYKKLRKRLLEERTFDLVGRLGPKGFQTPMWDFNVMLIVMSGRVPADEHIIAGVDAMDARTPAAKATLLRGASATGGTIDIPTSPGNTSPPESAPHPQDDDSPSTPPNGTVCLVPQAEQLKNPDARIRFGESLMASLTGEVARALQGLKTGDDDRFRRQYWEIEEVSDSWPYYQTTVDATTHWGGLQYRVDARESQTQWARPQGMWAWGKPGVAISQMSSLPVALYSGALFDSNMSAFVPTQPEDTLPLWCFCSDSAFCQTVRDFDQSLKVPNGSFEKIPFDIAHWRSIAKEQYPLGLPEPKSDDPTQWLFHGHPAHAEAHTALLVAVARLVGYLWPAELDDDIHLATEARAFVHRCAVLADHADEDGIVCLSSVQGEASAADRLRSLLAQAFDSDWTAAKEQDLLRAAWEHFHKGKVQPSLEAWLRDRFFEEHCTLFHKRPFVWHLWDGQPNGFHALVNYHRLAGPEGEGRRTLEKLTSTYLGEWIDRQRQLAAAGEEGAEGRLAAALTLQDELRKILEGEPPYDLFVRWKPLHEQPLGWDPDINDGVRLNIRPFLMAKDVGKKNAGILRAKPDNTWCNKKKPGLKDRGKEPQSLRPRPLFPWFWNCDPESNPTHRTNFGASTPDSPPAGKTFDGARWNNLHYTRAAKQAARAARTS